MTDKPEKRAIGLYYSGNKGTGNKGKGNKGKGNKGEGAHNPGAAPTVIAKGFNELADEIIRLAKENNVLVHEDPELANFLARLDVGDEIPRELYVIIAELIAFATWLDLKA